LECQNVLVTCDTNGMYLNSIDHHIQNDYDPSETVNVVGCGDVVLAVIVYMYFLYQDLAKACKIANYITTQKTIRCIGNYQISTTDILEAMEWESKIRTKLTCVKSPVAGASNKLIYDYEIDKIRHLSATNDRIVFTNGCFDIVHSAHIKLLKYARSLGKILVLGLNSDSSIKQLKGDSRPINSEVERIEFLSELDWIDYIIVFHDTTPYNILQVLRPDFLVKGGDYTIDQVIGNEFVKQVVLFDYIQNYSTSNIIRRSRGV
jgi:rfaE bifunctional protein nucleotidyltransferase chain/domain